MLAYGSGWAGWSRYQPRCHSEERSDEESVTWGRGFLAPLGMTSPGGQHAPTARALPILAHLAADAVEAAEWRADRGLDHCERRRVGHREADAPSGAASAAAGHRTPRRARLARA